MKTKSVFLICCLFCLTTVIAQNKPSNFNVKDYGAKGDGKANDTKAINAAVKACVSAGGGTVYFPCGTFVTGSFQIFSNIHLHLVAGSVIKGSDKNADYFYQKDFGFEGMGAGNKTGIVFAHKAENISITGQGVIDGNGNFSMCLDSLQYGMDFNHKYTRQPDYMDAKYGREDGPLLWRGTYEDRPGVMAIFSSCKNVSISGITFKESPNWTVAFLDCEDVKATRITINNNMDIPNSDGLDMYDSRNVIISDCVIHAGDDAIAIVSSSDITVTNCVLHSRSCGVRIGYNVFNNKDWGNLLFSNLRIMDSNRGIGIFQRQKGNLENIIFSDIIINTRLHSGQWWGNAEPIHISAVSGLGSTEVGTISNVRFSNIIAGGEAGILLYGSKESALKDIRFDNVQLTLKKGKLTQSYGGNFDLRPTNDVSLGIFKHDIPALFAGYINGLKLKDFEVRFDDTLPSFYSKEIKCENVTGLETD